MDARPDIDCLRMIDARGAESVSFGSRSYFVINPWMRLEVREMKLRWGVSANNNQEAMWLLAGPVALISVT